MDDRSLLCTGIAGTVLAGLCCATPILALLLGALGLSAWLVYTDLVVLPAIVVFLSVVFYALWRLRRAAG